MDQSRPVNHQAHQSFEKGKHFFNQWNEKNAEEAVGLFGKVIELEPEFFPAYTWLTKTFIFQAGRGYEKPTTVYPKAIALNEHVLNEDPDFGAALVLKGLIDFFYTLDWTSCYENIQKGLKSHEESLEMYQQLSLFWYGMKDYDQSQAALNAALEIDPLSLGVLNMVGDVNISRGDLSRAEKDFLYILQLSHDNKSALENLGYIHTLYGDRKNAFFYFKKLIKRMSPLEPNIPRMGYAYGKFGMVEEFSAYLRLFDEMQAKYPHKVFHNQLSQLYAGIQDWERVLELVLEGWRERTGILYILTDPMLEPIRETLEYDQLTKEIKLPSKLERSTFQDLTTSTNQSVRVNVEALLYLEADDNYVTLFINQNFRIEKVLIRQTLTQLIAQLPNNFIRIHRKYAINLNLNLKVTGNSRGLLLNSKKYRFTLPVSRQYVRKVQQIFPFTT